MKLLVLMLTSLCAASRRDVPEMHQFSADDARVRRGAVSYRTSVLHQNPKNPDQHAESSITVDFHTNKQQALDSSHTKTISRHPSGHQNNQNLGNSQVFDSPQSQAFNVGYSVRFKGAPHDHQSSIIKSRPSDDIITGSLKELVQKPSFDAQDYVNSALLDKKQKISGIKHKHKFHTKENDGSGFIPHLAPKTQAYLSYLGNPKPLPSARPLKQIQPTTESFTSWTNLSPTIEIYHSKDLPSSVTAGNFDHTGALAKGQGFNYRDIFDGLDSNGKYEHKEHRLLPVIDAAPSYKSVQVLPITTLQVTEKPSTIENKKPQLPIDTSLLRNPVLTVDGQNGASDSKSLPIPFDTRLLQAMQHVVSVHGDNKNRPLLHGHQIQENVAVNPEQQALFHRQPNFDQYFNHYLESMQPQSSLIDPIVMQVPNYNSRLNAAKDIELDLRPPPFAVNRRRRTFMY